jgi:hypothetical protein
VQALIDQQGAYTRQGDRQTQQRAFVFTPESLADRLAAAYSTNDNGLGRRSLPLYDLPVSAGVGVALDTDTTADEITSAYKQRLTIAGEFMIFLMTKYIPMKHIISSIFGRLEPSTVTIPPKTKKARNPITEKSIKWKRHKRLPQISFRIYEIKIRQMKINSCTVLINGNANRISITPDSGDEIIATSSTNKMIAKNSKSGSMKMDINPNSMAKMNGILNPLFTSFFVASARLMMGNPRQSNKIQHKNLLSYMAFARLFLDKSITKPPTTKTQPTISSRSTSSPAYSEYFLMNCIIIRQKPYEKKKSPNVFKRESKKRVDRPLTQLRKRLLS